MTERAVTESHVVSNFDGPGSHYWPLNEGRGEETFNYWGSHHGTLEGAEWTETEGGTGLAFAEGESVGTAIIEFDGGSSWSAAM